jgi:hypothetical protein
MGFPEIWHWVEKVAGVLFVVCLCLYLIRCGVAQRFIGIDQFGHFVQGLIHFICS